MTGQELFGVVVRAAGLWSFAEAFWAMPGLFHPTQGYTRLDYLPGIVGCLGLGLVLFMRADGIVRAAYREELFETDSNGS